MKYERSKTDSVLYCPFCGHGFRMTMERYFDTYKARDRGERFTRTSCNYCASVFYFRNITPESVKNGHKAILTPDEYKKWKGDNKMYHVEFLTDTDRIRGKNPVNMPDIRTISFTGARILVTDVHDHITVLSPADLQYIAVYPVNRGVNYGKE